MLENVWLVGSIEKDGSKTAQSEHEGCTQTFYDGLTIDTSGHQH